MVHGERRHAEALWEEVAAVLAPGELLEQMEDRQLLTTSFHRLGADFHLALAGTARNQVVAVIMTAL